MRKAPATRPLRFMTMGGIVSVLAAVAWTGTVLPHGGVELSIVLFPLWALWAAALFPGQTVPTLVWYAGALLHWTVLGAVVDLYRARQRRSMRAARDLSLR